MALKHVLGHLCLMVLGVCVTFVAHAETLIPPRPTDPITIAWPEEHAPPSVAIKVRVRLVVTRDGLVDSVEFIASEPSLPASPDLEDAVSAAIDAVLAAAANFRFSPATRDGQPVSVAVPFEYTFYPAPPPLPPETGTLRVVLRERGSKRPVIGATLIATARDASVHTASSDAQGRMTLELPPGTYDIAVRSPGYRPFRQRETLHVHQHVDVGYYLDADRIDPFEIIVRGQRDRIEHSRITLQGRELKQVPGSFGDPFRVILALPGVASTMSLVPYPVVRGASPGSTGFMLDGASIPMLYHLLAGPAVVHPGLIDDVDFHIGSFPAVYGGYAAGIVDGRTHRAVPDERLIDIDLNLTQVGGLVRQPLGGVTFTAAGRYGYPGALMGLMGVGTRLSYWDYQLRADARVGNHAFTAFFFGANDRLERETVPFDESEDVWPEPGNQSGNGAGDPGSRADTGWRKVVDTGFHRADLRYTNDQGSWTSTWRLVLGREASSPSGSPGVRSHTMNPFISFFFRPSPELKVATGFQGTWRDVGSDDNTDSDIYDDLATGLLRPERTQLHGALWVDSAWTPLGGLELRTGLRIDGRGEGDTFALSFDPRLAARFRLGAFEPPDGEAATEADMAWLELRFGQHHQPARLAVPIPGIEQLPLRLGQSRSLQSDIRVEIPIQRSWRLDIGGYLSVMDPAVFDLSIVGQDEVSLAAMAVAREGRAYGLEVMLRKRDEGRGLHGWVSYTLSKSERLGDFGWRAFDFDRRHLLNLVGVLALPRNWDFSVRVQYQSGRPSTSAYLAFGRRDSGYWRFDLRFDKRAVWNAWVLDFYVDLINFAVLDEDVANGVRFAYTLPTFGVRGRF